MSPTPLRRNARTKAARPAHKVIVGPWAHLFPYTNPTSTGTGDIDFGPDALISLHDIQLRWFDHWLKGIDTGILDERSVKTFVMGTNRWRGSGRANTSAGDAGLEARAPGDDPADHSIEDPD